MSDSTEYRPRQIRCYNISGEDIPAYSVASIDLIDSTTGVYRIGKPAEDNIPAAQLVITGPAVMPAGAYGIASAPESGKLSVIYSGSTPAAGVELGTKAGQWTLETDNNGFIAAGTFGGRAVVSPFRELYTNHYYFYLPAWEIESTGTDEMSTDWIVLDDPIEQDKLIRSNFTKAAFTVDSIGSTSDSFRQTIWFKSENEQTAVSINLRAEFADADGTLLYAPWWSSLVAPYILRVVNDDGIVSEVTQMLLDNGPSGFALPGGYTRASIAFQHFDLEDVGDISKFRLVLECGTAILTKWEIQWDSEPQTPFLRCNLRVMPPDKSVPITVS